MFPSIAQYNHTIQAKGGAAFKTFSNLVFVPSRSIPIKIFSYGSGSYAVVFKAKDGIRECAIRCFISADQENIERYRSLDQYLGKISESWVTKTQLLEQEINVEGTHYPVIKMEWVEGKLLNAYISDILNDHEALSALQREIVETSKSLEFHSVGHGDIQCGNVIVQCGVNGFPVIRLIDYDGMYIPAFEHKRNLEKGRSEFQHPRRSQIPYNEKIDRFSFWVILCALEALKYDKKLWLEKMQGGFNTLDNLLFVGDDFTSFHGSQLVNRLYALNQSGLTFYLDKIGRFCSSYSTIDAPELYNPLNINSIPFHTHPEESLTNEDKTFIRINSFPEGAAILNSHFQRIGITPLIIEKSTYLNKSIIVSFNNEARQITIDQDSTGIELTFTPTTNQLPLTNLENESKTQKQLPESATSSEEKSSEKETDLSWIFAIFLLIILAAIIYAINQPNGDTATSMDSYNSLTNEPYTSQTLSYPSDTSTYVQPDNTFPSTNNDTITSSSLSDNNTYNYTVPSASLKDDYGNNANDVVTLFFNALNSTNCSSAWLHTYNPSWEKKGGNWFCSTEAFGGITSIYMENTTVLSETTSKAVVHVEYYAEDNFNGNKCIRQDVFLEKIELDNYKFKWMIVRLKNTVQPYECELSE